ncbi:MAG: glycosyltransferase [Alphaproteobacteria bacterium]|nr:glycosyltransferase [Alphaproteobacteria bacterium]
MKGKWPNEYLNTPNPNKKIEEIWDDLDAFSFEEVYSYGKLLEKKSRLAVCIPPVKFGPYFIKGFCFSQASEYFLKKVPHLRKLFHICANSMTFSYPWSEGADCYFSLFENKAREKHYKKKYPEKKDRLFLPIQDADWTNDRVLAPWNIFIPKTIDVFCLSSPFPVKNLPMIAEMALVYEKKYNRRLKIVIGLGMPGMKINKDGSINYKTVEQNGVSELKKVDEIFNNNTAAYIEFVPVVEYKDLKTYFGMSKCAVLASICEGKNRFIHEAMAGNTPVVVFKDYDKFIRGKTPAIYSKSGEYAPKFTPESLADTVHKVIQNQNKYTPRKSYLEKNGRINFIKKICEYMPYYKEKVYKLEDNDLVHNKFFNNLMRYNYGITLEEFIYDKEPMLCGAVGKEDILEVLKGYSSQFKIPWVDVDDKDIHLFENK